MRIGICLPILGADGHPLDAEGLATRARWIEDAGLDGIWFNDASFRRTTGWPDPLTWLLVACNATSLVEVGSAVYQVPLRTPVDLAQRILTIQALTKGRFSFGVGAGSAALGYAAVGVPHEDRFRLFYEYMDTIRRLCNGEVVGEADLQAWPSVQGKPRFLLGAWHSDVSLRRAANEYEGWLSSAAFTSLDEIADALKRYRDLGGSRALIASVRVDLWGKNSAPSGENKFHLSCSEAEASERLHTAAELGFDDVILTIWDSSNPRPQHEYDFTLEQLEQVRALYPKDTRPLIA